MKVHNILILIFILIIIFSCSNDRTFTVNQHTNQVALVGIWRTKNNSNYEYRFYHNMEFIFRKIDLLDTDIGNEYRLDGIYELNSGIFIENKEKRILEGLETENEMYFDRIGWSYNSERIENISNSKKLEIKVFQTSDGNVYINNNGKRFWKVSNDPFEP